MKNVLIIGHEAEAPAGAQAVVDAANSPSDGSQAVPDFFETSDRKVPSGLRPNAAYSRLGRAVP